MINHDSFGRTQAGPMAAYNTLGLPRLTPEQEGALITLNPAAFEPAVLAALQAEWDARLAGLILAFEAVGERNMARVARTLEAAHPLDDALRDAMLGVLRHAPESYQDAVGRLAWIDGAIRDPDELRALSWERLVAAREQFRQIEREHPIRLRGDTSPQMRSLLGLPDGELPERKSLAHLMAGDRADGTAIPGKYYAVRRENAEPTGFFGLIFSPSKSVSVRAGFADPGQRQAIIAAHDKAVDTVMRDIEGDIGWVRRGKGGALRERGEITWITFRHELSRKGDPQLHTHVAVPNVVRSLESRAIGSLDTMRAQGRINSLHRHTYHEQFVVNLRERGIEAWFTRERGFPEAVLPGIEPEVLRILSQRRQDALRKAQEISGDLGALSDYARKRVINGAAKHTRPAKDDHDGNRQIWETRLEKAGWELTASHDPREGLYQDAGYLRMTEAAARSDSSHWVWPGPTMAQADDPRVGLYADQAYQRNVDRQATEEANRMAPWETVSRSRHQSSRRPERRLGRNLDGTGWNRGGAKQEWEDRGNRIRI